MFKGTCSQEMSWGFGLANQSKQIIIGFNEWPCQTSSSGSEGSQVSPIGDQESQLEARRLAILWSVSTQADCHGQLQFFSRRFLDELVRGQHKVPRGR